MKASSNSTFLDIRDIHEQLVQPITFLSAAMELWEQGLAEPEDAARMKGEIEKLVQVVRGLQTHMQTNILTLLLVA